MDASYLMQCIITEKQSNYDYTKKKAHDSQIVRAKDTLKLSYGGPSQLHASGTKQRIKALRQDRH